MKSTKMVGPLVAALALCGSAAKAQPFQSGPQVATFHSSVDDTDQPYGLYLPKHFNPRKSYPLVISLHGAGSNHRLNLRRVLGKSNGPGEADSDASRTFPTLPDVEYIVASPLARGTMGYQGLPEQDVMEVLAEVKRHFKIDPDRTYLTGLSMGGGGTCWIGLTHPDLFAAIAPVCPAVVGGTELYVPNALNLPVHVFQGGSDPVVSPAAVKEFVGLLKKAGTDVGYTEFPGVGHNSWEKAYADGGIFKWFANYRRNPYPAEVRFTTTRYEYSSAYWVKLDGISPGTPALIDIKFTAPNTLSATTEKLDGFTLSLAKHPQFKPGGTVEITVDGAKLVIPKVASTISLAKTGDKWVVGTVVGTLKEKGLEGPIVGAFSARHAYVYGTGGNPSPDELNRRRLEATNAATWSGGNASWWGGPGYQTQFPVMADREVSTDVLKRANVVLFGTATTNSVIAKYVKELPIQLNDDAKDVGLLYTYPIENHLAVISSGLPWWSNQFQIRNPRFRFRFGPQGPLTALGDFVLFRNSLGEILSEGYFGRDWGFSRTAAEAMQATGFVTTNRG